MIPIICRVCFYAISYHVALIFQLPEAEDEEDQGVQEEEEVETCIRIVVVKQYPLCIWTIHYIFIVCAGSAPLYLHGMQRNVILSMNWCQKEKEHCVHCVHSYCIYFIDRLEHEKSQLVKEYNMLYICIVFYCIFFCRLVIKSK